MFDCILLQLLTMMIAFVNDILSITVIYLMYKITLSQNLIECFKNAFPGAFIKNFQNSTLSLKRSQHICTADQALVGWIGYADGLVF